MIGHTWKVCSIYKHHNGRATFFAVCFCFFYKSSLPKHHPRHLGRHILVLIWNANSVFLNPPLWLPFFLSPVLPSLIDRLGDSKDSVREQDQALLLKIMEQAASPQVSSWKCTAVRQTYGTCSKKTFHKRVQFVLNIFVMLNKLYCSNR